jgi:hypothetical protein
MLVSGGSSVYGISTLIRNYFIFEHKMCNFC